MKKVKTETINRLRQILSIDRTLSVPAALIDLLRADTLAMLKNYFSIDDAAVEVKHDGEKYIIKIEAYAGAVKAVVRG